MRKAAFLDVDGCIKHSDRSQKWGNFYTLTYDGVHWIDGAIEAHKRLYDMGYDVFWVSMQNCINEKLITMYECFNIFRKMKDYVNEQVGSPVVRNYQICTSEENSEAKILAKI